MLFRSGYADKNDISFANISAAIAQGVNQWANTPSSTSKTVYTINGKNYTCGELGYLYDEDGFKSNYRVDDVSKLYNENDTELGYFNEKGLFISK